MVFPPQTPEAGQSSPKISDGHEGAGPSPFELAVIEVFVDMMQTLGMPKSYGEIYGLLYATAEPLGFAEIHERLSLSKGSVSGSLKALKDIGAVRVVTGTTDRRERFEPELEVRKLVLNFMKERLQPQLQENGTRIGKLDKLLTDVISQNDQSRKVLENRLAKLGKWRKKASGLMPWISNFLA